MMMYKSNRQKSNWKMFGHDRSLGFTLIEMIVALAIFSVVAVVALGALMKIISANKKAQSLMSAMTNINFALESMSREMRVGSNFYCVGGETTVGSTFTSTGCPTGLRPSTSGGTDGPMIAFRSSKVDSSQTTPCNLIYAYHFVYDGSRWDILKASQAGGNGCTDTLTYNTGSPGSAGNFSSIIDKNVIITDYFIKVTSASFPLATIRISGYVGARETERTYFDVQTAISARTASDTP